MYSNGITVSCVLETAVLLTEYTIINTVFITHKITLTKTHENKTRIKIVVLRYLQFHYIIKQYHKTVHNKAA